MQWDKWHAFFLFFVLSLSVCLFYNHIPLSLFLMFNIKIVFNIIISFFRELPQPVESKRARSLTHIGYEVHWCLSTERKVFLSVFSSHLMLRKSFHTWGSSLTETHTHACVWIIHATEKWCRVTKVGRNGIH